MMEQKPVNEYEDAELRRQIKLVEGFIQVAYEIVGMQSVRLLEMKDELKKRGVWPT